MNITYTNKKNPYQPNRGEILLTINWYKEFSNKYEPEIVVDKVPVTAFLVLNLETNTTEVVLPDQIKTAVPLELTVDLLNK